MIYQSQDENITHKRKMGSNLVAIPKSVCPEVSFPVVDLPHWSIHCCSYSSLNPTNLVNLISLCSFTHFTAAIKLGDETGTSRSRTRAQRQDDLNDNSIIHYFVYSWTSSVAPILLVPWPSWVTIFNSGNVKFELRDCDLILGWDIYHG